MDQTTAACCEERHVVGAKRIRAERRPSVCAEHNQVQVRREVVIQGCERRLRVPVVRGYQDEVRDRRAQFGEFGSDLKLVASKGESRAIVLQDEYE